MSFFSAIVTGNLFESTVAWFVSGTATPVTPSRVGFSSFALSVPGVVYRFSNVCPWGLASVLSPVLARTSNPSLPTVSFRCHLRVGLVSFCWVNSANRRRSTTCEIVVSLPMVVGWRGFGPIPRKSCHRVARAIASSLLVCRVLVRSQIRTLTVVWPRSRRRRSHWLRKNVWHTGANLLVLDRLPSVSRPRRCRSFGYKNHMAYVHKSREDKI